jgi:hypothetical protein
MNLNHFFESLSAERVQGMIDARQEEHVGLDFKVVADVALASKDDRKNFAKALSGFANSAGGVIIWGVDARKTPDGVDAACELRPLASAATLVSRLNQLTGEYVAPTVLGVRHRAILLSGPSGVVASLSHNTSHDVGSAATNGWP